MLFRGQESDAGTIGGYQVLKAKKMAWKFITPFQMIIN